MIKYRLVNSAWSVEDNGIARIYTIYSNTIMGHPGHIDGSNELYFFDPALLDLTKNVDRIIIIDEVGSILSLSGDNEELVLIALSWKSEWGDRV